MPICGEKHVGSRPCCPVGVRLQASFTGLTTAGRCVRSVKSKQASLTKKTLIRLPRYRLGYIVRNYFSKVHRTRELSAERLGVYNRRPVFCRLSEIQAVTRIHALVFIRTVARASEPSAFAFPDRDLEKVSGGTASSGVSTSAVRYKTP